MSGEKRGFEVDSAKVTDNRGLSSVAWFVMMALQGCSNESGELERAFVKKLIEHKIDNVSSIDLREVFGIQWKKACLQVPYMSQSDFEKFSGERVKSFEGISDDRYAVWVFYSDGHANRIEIERVKVMEYRGIGSRCTSLQQPYLYFNVIDGEKKYFFDDGEVLK